MLDARIATLLRDHFGLDPASIGEQGVARIVSQRALAVCGGDTRHYLEILSQSPDELRELVELLVVPETWFFRYPESMRYVSTCVAAALRGRRGDQPVRILSMPCSTGEEPYSVAIALRDLGIAQALVQIDALDISEVAIERARLGRYGRNAFRTASVAFRDQHFKPLADGRYALADGLREQVDFRCENVFALSAATLAQPYDLVLCRNLLIYFDVPTQQRVVRTLERLCAPTGTLLLGPAEAGLLVRMGYRHVGEPAAFAFEPRPAQAGTVRSAAKVATIGVSDSAGLPALPGARQLSAATHAVPARRTAWQPRAQAAGSMAVAPVRVAASRTAARSRDDSLPPADANAAAIDGVRRLADQGSIDQAAAAAQQLIERDSANAEAHFWLGLCRDVQGDKPQAAVHYRKAIYLVPAHVAALNHLAALLDEQGDGGGAQRLRQRAMREEARHGE